MVAKERDRAPKSRWGPSQIERKNDWAINSDSEREREREQIGLFFSSFNIERNSFSLFFISFDLFVQQLLCFVSAFQVAFKRARNNETKEENACSQWVACPFII